MKKITYNIILLLTVSLLFSCSKDFLDTEEDQYLTKERIEELKASSPEAVVTLVQGSLNGMYNNSIAYMEKHDDFGLKAFMLATDLAGIDMIQTKHHWFGWDYNMDNRSATYRRTKNMWKFFYKQISSANIILADFYAKPVESAILKQKKGEVLAWRGISYYYLVNLYQQTYKGHENAPGVPLLLNTTDENMPRAKVSEVYAQIIEDLTYAVNATEYTDKKTDIDKAVAAAYLAKTYAAMEDWAKVAEYAKIAIAKQPLASPGLIESAKWDIGNSDWLWGFDVTGETTTLYASFYSHMDNTIGGYAGGLGITKAMYSNLYHTMGVNDVRRKLVGDNFVCNKYVTPGDFTGDYCFLRVEDPYLLLIEADVELNKLDEAKTLLADFMAVRDPDYDVAKLSSQDELRREVRIQRRLELWGEGTSFFDIKRWKIGIDRGEEGSNHRTKIKVPAGDKKWVYQIPQSEIDANPNIGEQNP